MANDTNLTTTDRVDPKSGYDPKTKIFHSLRPAVPLPPRSQPLSLSHFALSLLRSSADDPNFLSTTPVLIDNSTGRHVSYSLFLRQIRSLSVSLIRSLSLFSLPHSTTTATAFVLCPNSVHVPVIYFSLLSLGVTVSPANPLGSASEIAHQIRLTRPDFAFTTSATAGKLPKDLRTILIDSPEFLSMLENDDESDAVSPPPSWREVRQSDVAAVLFSSGTTGRVKGVALSHRNFIANIAGFHAQRLKLAAELESAGEAEPQPVSLMILPMFHVFGFFMAVRAVAMGETMVVMERFDLEGMLRAVERHMVTYIPVSPPLVVALTKSEVVGRYDLSSLLLLGSGGAPLGKEVVENFQQKFPNVEITQVRW